MGCLFAARLAHAGIHTTLVDHRPERATRLAASGIHVEGLGDPLHATPVVTTDLPEEQDLVIVCVKAYSTASLKLRTDAPVLSLQNGLGNVETLCNAVGSANVLAGVTEEAAQTLGDGRVRHMASDVTRIGAWTSCPTAAVEECFARAGLRLEVTASPGQILWEQVSIRSALDPLSALLNVSNGRLLEIAEARQLMRDLVVESVKVASTEGYRFGYSLVEHAEERCRRFADCISPMLQDTRAGRRTEIEAISGEILRRAQLAALPTPRTRVIWQLVKGLEQR